MKIKVELDIQEHLTGILEDAFYDNESEAEVDIVSAVKLEIITQIKKDVFASIGEEIKEEMIKEVKNLLLNEFKGKAADLFDDFVENGKIKGKYTNDDPISVNDWIQEEFKNVRNYYSLQDSVQKQSAKVVSQIKERYDLLFATQFVNKMNEQNLLKPGVWDSLTEPKKS